MAGPVIKGTYIDSIREICYLGRADMTMPRDVPQAIPVINHGHRFRVLGRKDESFTKNEVYEVVGWLERTPDCPYDFLIKSVHANKYYIANIHGRSDEWPLFAMQNGKTTCSRTIMGPEWNCRLCAKYFSVTCKGR